MNRSVIGETSLSATTPTGSRAAGPRQQGLAGVRLCLVVASLAPLFILWAIAGISYIPDSILAPFCAFAVVIPHLILLARLRVARQKSNARHLVVARACDRRYHLFAYLFAILMPFYRHDVGTFRSAFATVVALAVIVALFYSLDMLYINVLLAAWGYRVYGLMTVPAKGSPYEDAEPIVLVSRRRFVQPADRIRAYRVTATLYWECTT